MSQRAGSGSNPQSGGIRLGGVRADFVANLGKRLAELRGVWGALLDDPTSDAPRDELRRHIHALATRSRVLHFDALANRLDRAERRLERAAAAGGIDAEDVTEFDELLRDLPELAWSEVGEQNAPTWKGSGEAKASNHKPSSDRAVPTWMESRAEDGARHGFNEAPRTDSDVDPWAELSIPTWTSSSDLPEVTEVPKKWEDAEHPPISGGSTPPAPKLPPESMARWSDEPSDESSGSRNDSPNRAVESKEEVEPASSPAQDPLAILVIGRLPLARSLEVDTPSSGASLEIERTEDLQTALELTRALAPDAVVLDGDLPGAVAMSAALARDPIAESTPVIVVGSWSHPDQAAPFLAHGVLRALLKPVSPAKLQQALRDIALRTSSLDPNTTLGTLSVDELAERLANQVRSGLTDTLRPESRHVSIELGQGTEVLAAVWGAVARIREMLTIQSNGVVRFSNTGPIGAVPVAPWLDIKEDQSDRRQGNREQAQEAKLLLQGRRVLVVDDDPAVTWFLSGLFRAHGCSVREAGDGLRALDIAYRFDPDLVVTDILMPNLDGFGLCRALKRDILLRDVPVIVLSWKEDLLQRMRELGVGADGYLRKEATSAAILRTVNESLRSRTRIEERLQNKGEVRGRLDGLTARTLLSLVGKALPDACVSVRDANHLFEVQLRGGTIRDATRTAVDGTSARGNDAIISLLRVFTGRFHVVPSTEPLDQHIDASLDEIVAHAVTQARAAQHLLEGAGLLEVARVALRLDRLALDSVPESVRSVYQALARGMSPRHLIEDGHVSASSLEQILADAAVRGAVQAVLDGGGTDLIAHHAPPQGPSRESFAFSPPTDDLALDESAEPSSPLDLMQQEETTGSGTGTRDGETASGDLSLMGSRTGESYEDSDAPTSLAEAVIREVGGDSRGDGPASGKTPSMLDVTDLRPRSTVRPETTSLPSLPPDAIVPGADVADLERLDSAEEPSIPGVPSLAPPPDNALELLTDTGTAHPVDDEIDYEDREDDSDDGAEDEGEDDAPDDGNEEEDSDGNDDEEDSDDEEDEGSDDGDDEEDEGSDGDDDEEDEGSDDDARESDGRPEEEEDPKLPTRSLVIPILVTVGLVAGVVAASVYLWGGGSSEQQEGSTGEDGSLGFADSVGQGDLDVPGVVEEKLSTDGFGEPPPGQGLLEVVTGHEQAAVHVNDRSLGSGEVIRMFLPPGKHRVAVEWEGRRLRGELEVSEGKRTRWTLEDAWSP